MGRNAAGLIVAVTCALVASAPAGALAPGGGATIPVSCPDVQGALWVIDDHPYVFSGRPSAARSALDKSGGTGWAVTVARDASSGDRSDPTTYCPAAGNIASTDSSQATVAATKPGLDGSSCTFSAPDSDSDHGVGKCDNATFTVTFQPAHHLLGSTNCPVAGTRSPGSRLRSYGHGWQIGVSTLEGADCATAVATAQSVPRPKVHLVTRMSGYLDDATVEILPPRGGYRWWCAAVSDALSRGRRKPANYLGRGICWAEANTAVGWLRVGTSFSYFITPKA